MELGLSLRVVGQERWAPVRLGVSWLNEVLEDNGMTTRILVGAEGVRRGITMEALEAMTLGELLYLALFSQGVPAA